MKRKYLFMFFIINLILAFDSVFAFTCEYNYSGYKDDEILWSLDTETGKAKQLKVIGNLHDSGKEEIINWSSGEYYYGKMDTKNGTCPKYLIQSKGMVGLGGDSFGVGTITNKMFVSNQTHLMSVLKMKNVQKSGGFDREVHVLQLATKSQKGTKEVTCKYEGTVDLQGLWTIEYPVSFSLDYDKSGNLIGYSTNFANFHQFGVVSYTAYNTKIQANTCNASLAICVDATNIDQNVSIPDFRAYISFGDTLREDVGYKETEECSVLKFTSGDSESGEEIILSENCDGYNTYRDEAKAAAKAYKSCKDSGNSGCGDYLKKFTLIEEKWAMFCKAVYSSITYGDSCVNACTKYYSTELAKIKVDNDIDVVVGKNSSCSLSGRIIDWLFKIIQWIRYLVPILLILLSVMDFIKAVASDSEDEMKKVGAKFVKRLIVAALIFLLPLVLEFILGIFNIDTKNFCLS